MKSSVDSSITSAYAMCAPKKYSRKRSSSIPVVSRALTVCPAMSVCKTEPPAPIAANILRSMNKPPGSNLKIYDIYSFYHEFVIFQH